MFKGFGVIEKIQMPKKSQNSLGDKGKGKNKGFCLVTFSLGDEAQLAQIKTEELRLFGREIRVKAKDF